MTLEEHKRNLYLRKAWYEGEKLGYRFAHREWLMDKMGLKMPEILSLERETELRVKNQLSKISEYLTSFK